MKIVEAYFFDSHSESEKWTHAMHNNLNANGQKKQVSEKS